MTDGDRPLSQADDEEVVLCVQQWQADGKNASSGWREEARECYRFVAGDQWSEEDRATLKAEGRPEITFNRVGSMMDAIAGAQVNNRQETKFLPRTMDDGGKAEVVQGVVQWVRDNCDAEDEESDAFRDAATCGLGFIETRMDYTDDPDGKIVMERVSPFEMQWDPAATKKNLADARWLTRSRRMSAEEVRAIWDNADLAISGASDVEMDGEGEGSVNPTRDAYADGPTRGKLLRDRIEVTEAQWCELHPEIVVADPFTGQAQRLSAEQWEKLGERLGEEQRDALNHTRIARKRWYRAVVCGGEVLERSESPIPDMPTMQAITCRRDQIKGCWYGVVRAALDPQRWANKWLAQGLHILNTGAKSGALAEEGTVKDVREFEATYAKPGALTVLQPGALTGGRFQPKVPAPFPAGFDRLIQYAVTSVQDVTGINRELLGTADRDQAGVLEWQRKQAAQATLAPLFDALRLYYKREGRLLLHFVQKFIPPDRVLRITMPDGDQQMVMQSQLPDIAEYDVVVDQAPTSPNQKMEVWGFLQPSLPALLKMGLPLPVWAELLRYSPLPESAVNKMIEGLEQMAQQAPPPDPEVEKAKAQIALQQQKQQGDMQMSAARAQQDMAIEARRAEQDMAIREQDARLDGALAVEKARLDAGLARQKAAQQARAKPN